MKSIDEFLNSGDEGGGVLVFKFKLGAASDIIIIIYIYIPTSSLIKKMHHVTKQMIKPQVE